MLPSSSSASRQVLSRDSQVLPPAAWNSAVVGSSVPPAHLHSTSQSFLDDISQYSVLTIQSTVLYCTTYLLLYSAAAAHHSHSWMTSVSTQYSLYKELYCTVLLTCCCTLQLQQPSHQLQWLLQTLWDYETWGHLELTSILHPQAN